MRRGLIYLAFLTFAFPALGQGQLRFTLPSFASGGGTGNVVGPGAACSDNQVVRWNGASNTALQCSVLTVADTTGDISAPGALTISTAASNGDITLDPHGTGIVKVDESGGMKVMGLDTDASNYERLSLSCDGTADCTIATETAGTGGDNVNLILDPAGTGEVVVQERLNIANGANNFQIIPDVTANEGFEFFIGGFSRFFIRAGYGTVLPSSGRYSWSNSGAATDPDDATVDTGIYRSAAGVVRIEAAANNIGALLNTRVVTPDTDGETTTDLQSGTVWTNTGDGDGEAITLLNDPGIGVQYCFAVDVAQTITVAPSTGETLYYGTDQCVVSLTSASIGSTLCVVAITGGSGAKWFTMSHEGSWTCND